MYYDNGINNEFSSKLLDILITNDIRLVFTNVSDISRCLGQGMFVSLAKLFLVYTVPWWTKPFLPDAAGLYQRFFREIESDAPIN